MRCSVALLCLLALLGVASAFYLPGVAPREYSTGEPVAVKVNKLSSASTQLPYNFYSLPFCAPDPIVDAVENLGEILSGDRIENSLYEVDALVDQECKVLCKPVTYNKAQLKAFETRIKEQYRVNWIVDNLPGAVKRYLVEPNGRKTLIYEPGFALGRPGEAVRGGVKGKYYINNHVDMTLKFHQPSNSDLVGVRIVGFEVSPRSIAHPSKFQGVPKTCTSAGAKVAKPQSVSEDTATITWTYGVKWINSEDIRWATRWDAYLKMTDSQIHWFSIINSLMIVLFLTGMVAMIMIRTLHADFRKYRELETQEEAQEETGWKLVHGDVFRPPAYPMLLSVLVGSGTQVFAMCVITLSFSVLGFLSPANRGGLLTAMIVLFVLMGVCAGYTASRLYKMFKGVAWKKLTLTTACLLPGIVFAIFFVLNFFIWGQHSTGAVSFTTLIALASMWFGISLPLVLFGSYFGFRKPAIEHPTRTNQIPRQVPPSAWYMKPAVSVLMGGILPFGAIFIELFFILSSIWLNQFYYLFGFLFIVFCILVVTCAEITVVMCYFQLCSEDYHWWWRSFLTSGASALYMFLYTGFYFATKLTITKPVSVLMYFAYSAILCICFFVLTGCVGFAAAFWFTHRIFSSVKID